MGVTGAAPTGLSPRVRGSRMTFIVPICISGSIPACAGEPRISDGTVRVHWVYPRVCGGAPTDIWNTTTEEGLSPRVRGSPAGTCVAGPGYGSIPACAGEPLRRPTGPGSGRVYPRVCGGALRGHLGVAIVSGLSPRVRGSREATDIVRASKRSIPACAGEPHSPHSARSCPRVYPRVCGGARRSLVQQTSDRGLSPRVRGSPERFYPGQDGTGSIPACAGGARIASRCAGLMRGLSPRVRGSPGLSVRRALGSRSIPACAGEPGPNPSSGCTIGVYPRVCGGSHAVEDAALALAGSIPACAGEPDVLVVWADTSRVYPRVCGGASYITGIVHPDQGLSPRVRGSPKETRKEDGVIRSIPACAGEPSPHSGSVFRLRVYPRVCGGAAQPIARTLGGTGLSPRVRGSPDGGWLDERDQGSIPACAGEPASTNAMRSQSQVYPRVCGGAPRNRRRPP